MISGTCYSWYFEGTFSGTHDANPKLRKAVAEKIQNSPVLANIARNDLDPRVRAGAVGNKFLTDQSVLRDIASNDPESNVRLAAINNSNLNDKKKLNDIAENASDEEIRQIAKKILEQNGLDLDLSFELDD